MGNSTGPCEKAAINAASSAETWRGPRDLYASPKGNGIMKFEQPWKKIEDTETLREYCTGALQGLY